MSNVVHFQGGRREVARVVRALIGSVLGNRQSEVARGVFLAIGFAALSDIQADFLRKARGGTGEDGQRWQRLSPKTLAYSRRFGPGEKTALKKAAGLGRANSFAPGGKAGLLTKSQLKRWRQVYGHSLARLAVSMPFAQAKARAAATAWSVVKGEGGKTMLEVYGNRTVEILRDTSVLFNSLSLGEITGGAVGASYTRPRLPGGDQQIFDTLDNGVIVGTNVPYAAVHNYGSTEKGIPARPFIPEPENIPTVWLDRWLNAGMVAVSNGISQSLAAGGVR